jgi:hypothetical protein
MNGAHSSSLLYFMIAILEIYSLIVIHICENSEFLLKLLQ